MFFVGSGAGTVLASSADAMVGTALVSSFRAIGSASSKKWSDWGWNVVFGIVAATMLPSGRVRKNPPTSGSVP